MGLLLRALYVLLKGFFFSLWSRLWAFILFVLPWVIEKVLILLGIGFVSYQGFDFIIDRLSDFIFSRFDNLLSDLYAILVILKLDVGIAILFAAMSIALSIKLMTAGSKLIFKSKGTFEA